MIKSALNYLTTLCKHCAIIEFRWHNYYSATCPDPPFLRGAGARDYKYTCVYTGMHEYTQVYTGIHEYTQVYTSIHKYTRVYMSIQGIHRYTQVYTSIHRYTHKYTWVYMSIQGIHEYTQVYTSNSLSSSPKENLHFLFRFIADGSIAGSVAGSVDLVSRARLSHVRKESGQIPIIISCLTHQEFLGVLMDLVASGARGYLFGSRKVQTECR